MSHRQRLRNYFMCAGAVLALVSGTPSAVAAVDTTTFTVSASIIDACDVQATNHAFGAYTPSSGSALDGTSAINVYCTVGTPYSLALDVGAGGGAFTGRKMKSGSNDLLFNLYTTAARSTVWGDGTGATATVSGNGSGLLTASTHTVYGRIAINQDAPPGAYSSVITVTLTF